MGQRMNHESSPKLTDAARSSSVTDFSNFDAYHLSALTHPSGTGCAIFNN